jgi:hypothetical protein
MNKKIIIILIIIAVIIIGCCGGGLIISLFPEQTSTDIKSQEITLIANSTTIKPKPTKTSKPTAKILKLTASELSKEYQKNEIKANNLYKDKNVEIEGKIESITESDFLVNTVSIRLEGYNYNCISCLMKSRKGLEDYNIGDKITIKGKCDGISVFDVCIVDCEMIK